MKYLRIRQVCLIFLSVLLVALLLSGCRKTTVLEQIVYSDNADEIDYDQWQYEMENNSEIDPDMEQNQQTEEEQEKDQETDAVEGDDDLDAQHVSDLEYNESSENNTGGTTGNSSNEDGESGNPSGSDSDIDGDNHSDQLNPTNNSQALRQIIDANGNVIKIPENVDRVSAVGATAAYVEMLGGSGRLVATSSSFAESAFTSKVFGESVQVLWSGNGGSALSDSDFNKLLAADPQVCLVENGSSTFSDAQIRTLQQKGIYCVTVPKFNTSSNIKDGVTLLGTILGDKSSEGGQDAVKNASDYVDWYESVISTLSSKCDRFSCDSVDYDNDRSVSKKKYFSGSADGYYCLFADSWDSSASYRVFNDSKGTVMSGKGAAGVVSGYSSSPLSYYMSMAGVGNVAASYDDFGTQHEWYLNGLLKGDYAVTISGSYMDYTAGLQDCPYLTKVVKADNSEVHLGTEKFNTIIAATSDIKKNIESSPLLKNYPEISTPKGTVRGVELSGNYLGSVVYGDYTVKVNPHGAASWCTGSPESPLEGLWISSTFGTGVSENELKSEIKNFYSKFYRYSLTDAQVTSILKGI